ncbi:MAG: hypothetical protein AB7N70_26915, partial [Dehalococcoidia bacterium]
MRITTLPARMRTGNGDPGSTSHDDGPGHRLRRWPEEAASIGITRSQPAARASHQYTPISAGARATVMTV